MEIPKIADLVHYVSHGTPVQPDGSQEYTSQCRAAVVTEVGEFYVPEDEPRPRMAPVSLAVLNPEGMFFNRGVTYHDGSGQPAHPKCPEPHETGPHRYCPCGWTEQAYRGGTWHEAGH